MRFFFLERIADVLCAILFNLLNLRVGCVLVCDAFWTIFLFFIGTRQIKMPTSTDKQLRHGVCHNQCIEFTTIVEMSNASAVYISHGEIRDNIEVNFDQIWI